jgi:hypothetical protein
MFPDPDSMNVKLDPMIQVQPAWCMMSEVEEEASIFMINKER